jgi:protein TonB
LLSVAAAWAHAQEEPPIPVRTVAPDYPLELRLYGVSGRVMVSCRIDARGNVVETRIEKSSHRVLEQPAQVALQQWKFRPARRNGKPAPTTVSIPFEFVSGR